MSASNDTLLAEFYMDDFNRKLLQEKRALQARNNTTGTKPNTEEKVTDKSSTKEKAVEKVPFDHAAFLAWAKNGPIKQPESLDNNKKSESSSSRLTTY